MNETVQWNSESTLYIILQEGEERSDMGLKKLMFVLICNAKIYN